MKKIISIAAAAACMATVISTAAVPVTAYYSGKSITASAEASKESKEDSAMKKALETVKKRVLIPEEYSEFTYQKSTSNKLTTYNFRWTNGSNPSDSIMISICGNVITSYSESANSGNWNSVSFSKIGKEELKKSAKAALKALNPDIAAELELNDFSVNLHGDNAYISFARKVNGLPFSNNSGRMTLDKNTGKIITFYMTFWEDAVFEDAKKAIDSSKMQSAYKENVTLFPHYVIRQKYIEESDSYDKEAVIIYSPDKNIRFNALTGKPTEMDDDRAEAYNTSNYSLFDTVEEAEEAYDDDSEPIYGSYAAGSGADKGVSFTESEKKALLESNKYYSQSDAVKLLLKDKYLGLTEKYAVSYASFNKDESSPSGYVWSFNFNINTKDDYRSIQVNIDAESGKILNFYKYKNYSKDKKVINVKTVNEIAENAAKYYLPELMESYRANEESNNREVNKETERNISFTRYVNDLPVTGDSVNLRVDSEGEVMAFNYTYTDIKFPSAAGIITKDTAYTKLFSQTDFSLYYDGFRTLDGKSKTYMLFSIDNSYSINARSGKICNSYGADVDTKNKPEAGGCPYTDIKGHWSEKYITALYEYGVKLPVNNNEFKPDEYITNAEFAKLMNEVFYSDIMPILYKDDGYTYQTAKKFGNETMTKTDLAKQFVISANGDSFAALKGIYKSPFADVKDDDPNIGYISLAYGMGALKPDSKGKLNPSAKVSRAYAMYSIYSYIESLS